MNLIQTKSIDRAFSIALPLDDVARDWNNVFAKSCGFAGFANQSINRLSDRLSSAQQMVDGRRQRIDFCSLAGDGAFFANDIFIRGPVNVSYRANGDLYIQIHLRGIAHNVANGYTRMLRGPTCMLTYHPPNTTRVMHVGDDQEWLSASICIKPQALVSEFGIHPNDLPHPLNELLRGNVTDGFTMEFPLPGDVVRILNGVWDCPDRSSLRQLLVEAKAREIVYWILRQAQEKSGAVHQQLKSIGVKTSKVEKVQEILESELHLTHSLQSLADRSGLSRTALCIGFKQWSGMAVFEYLHLKRMERAWRTLEENRHSVQQVASITGYQDESAFSRAFRKHFGVQPMSVVRKEYRLS
jgi:AraC family transcriptional activator of pyochelin receptor